MKTPPSGQSCTVGSTGSGSIGSANVTGIAVTCTFTVTTAQLTGSYSGVTYDITFNANSLTTATLDGNGAYSGTEQQNTAGVIASASTSGTYSIISGNVLTVNTLKGAVLGANQQALVATDLTTNRPVVLIAVKRPGSGASNASLNGPYAFMDLEVNSQASGAAGDLAFITMDGNGNFSGSNTGNSSGSISMSTVSGTYAVTADGTVTTDSGHLTGAMSADGDLVVLADLTSGDPANLTVGVKQGTGESAATLNGSYAAVLYHKGATGPESQLYSAIFDGQGNFSGTYTDNYAGTVSNNQVSGTYTVASNGTLIITTNGGSTKGAVSADGNVFALAQVTSGGDPTIIVGLRQ